MSAPIVVAKRETAPGPEAPGPFAAITSALVPERLQLLVQVREDRLVARPDLLDVVRSDEEPRHLPLRVGVDRLIGERARGDVDEVRPDLEVRLGDRRSLLPISD